MKTTSTWAFIFGLVLTSSPAIAQDYWYVPHVDEAATPIEVRLQSNDLAMPGFGIGSTKAAIIKRLEYALDHKWLSAAQDQQLCNDLKGISDREQSLRGADGQLSFKSKMDLARQLNDLNGKFEEMVLVREQSSPGIQGLLARQALLIERVNRAVNDGKLTGRRATQLKSDIRAVAVEVPDNKEISDEQSKKIASELSGLNNEIDRELVHGTSTATRPLPFTR